MAVCLGRPQPQIPATVMNPKKEKEVYDGLEKLLEVKKRGRQAV